MFNVVISLLIVYSLYTSYKELSKDSSLLKYVYFSRPLDYLWAFLLVIFVSTSCFFAFNINLPSFMTWSWTSIFSDDSSGGNLIAMPFRSKSIVIVTTFWFLLSLALPHMAKSEEKMFRSLTLSTKHRIISSIKFGLVHMTVGVPLYIALILSVVGYILSIFYVKSFLKNVKIDAETADEKAINVSTSVHAKYNFLLITIGATLTTLLLVFS